MFLLIIILNFDSFFALIDTIGGIDVDVPVTFTEQDSQDQADAIHLEKGYQLNGEQALALTRTRHIDNDFIQQIKCTDKYINGIYYAQPDVESVRKISKDLKQELQKNKVFTIKIYFMLNSF
ncbi:cell envelope-related transcriptional attenuator domain protein [Bacillus clarus]|uniref:Cell envelope-related transcriptional attenuator domain protein n=1 Tax=Bacillus clarus TaxID=2338372 RepID=A0A090Y9N0_9BACI|nr:cell envelope-related transcriptional attenuator domain protein [Bacillus clarus]